MMTAALVPPRTSIRKDALVVHTALVAAPKDPHAISRFEIHLASVAPEDGMPCSRSRCNTCLVLTTIDRDLYAKASAFEGTNHRVCVWWHVEIAATGRRQVLDGLELDA